MIQLYEEPKIKIIDSEVTGNPKPVPEGKYVLGGGIEMPCK